MATKTLIRLLVALAVLAAAAVVLHFMDSKGTVSKIDSSTDKRKVFADFPINDIAKVVIREKEATVTLTKGEKSWQVAEREDYAADSAPIIALLRKIWDLNIVQPITIGRTQYGRLGLLDPGAAETKADEAATLLVFQDKDGKDLASLWLGKVYERAEGRPDPFGGGMAKTDAGRYVKRGDANSVYLVSDTFSDVKTEAPAWLDKTFFKVEKIKTLEIATAAKGDDWKLERDSDSADFALANAAAGEKLDPNKVVSMKAAFGSPQIEDVFVGDETKEQKTDKATFKIETFDGFRYEIATGEKNDLNELPLTIKVSAEFPKERKPGEEESDEEKKKLDEEFANRIAGLQKKLEQEKQLEGHVFKVRSYIVDSIVKKRSELMEEKKEEPKANAEEVAPGVSLPGLPPAAANPAPAPAPAPEPKPEPAPQPEAVEEKPEPKEAKEAPAPQPEAAAKPENPEPAKEAPAAEAPAPGN